MRRALATGLVCALLISVPAADYQYPRCNCDEERIWSVENILECQIAVLPCGQDRSWTVEEVEIIEVVADQMAVAISHAAMPEDSQLMRDKLVEQNRAWQRAKKNGMRLAKRGTGSRK
ncbi:hypothetical protein Nepgr_020601 [Nepenthes gracilis]|uniref:Uncharacterized protein n=1 Tax=Nepenthes gracilis TaxID=150966 RepID=A0AAD3SX53_NEPGR|nr:hypothetical protein Nepgr_020601 [Nepenthes gracilis]